MFVKNIIAISYYSVCETPSFILISINLFLEKGSLKHHNHLRKEKQIFYHKLMWLNLIFIKHTMHLLFISNSHTYEYLMYDY